MASTPDKNGEPIRAHPSGDRLAVYTDKAMGERWRRYCIKHRVTFSALAVAAISYFMEHCEPPKNDPLKLPTGKRIRPTR